MANSARAARPPSTPPIIAPRFEGVAFRMLVGVLDGEAAPGDAARAEERVVAPVASGEVNVSVVVEWSEAVSGIVDLDEEGETAVVAGSSDEIVTASVKVVIDEVVVVLGVTLGSRLIAPTVLVSDRSDNVVAVLVLSSSLSGQIPVTHGSLEQHPRKFPTLQTYHCLLPVQALVSRGKRASIESMLES